MVAAIATSSRPHVLVRKPLRDESQTAIFERRRRSLETGLMVGVPAFLIALWQVAASLEWIDPRIYPSPSTILVETANLISSGRLAKETGTTLTLLLIGYAIGTLSGFIVGIAMGVSRLARVALESTLNGLYVVPKLALLPIFLMIFGFEDAPKVALGAVTVFFFAWIEAMEATASVPEGYREAARSFGVSGWQMFRHVLLPAALPQLFVGLRIATGVAILVIVAAEFVVGNKGLGYLIFNSRALLLISWSYVGIVEVAVIGVLFAWVVTRTGRYFTPWDDRHTAMHRR